jgi:3-oxoadipate enol-lactonase
VTAVDLHHVVDGPAGAPPVLLLGSLGSTLAMWEAQVAALAGPYRVVRADLRGHGGSPAPPGPYAIDDLVADAVALLDRLGIGAAHVVGVSLGGMTAMRLAALHPDRVDRLAVLCTSALLGRASDWAERAATVRASGTGAVAPAVVGRWFTEARRKADPDLVARHERMVAGTPPEGYAACCEAIAVMDLRADLPRIVAPTLAIAGADDPATPPDHLREIAAAVPGARLLVLPGPRTSPASSSPRRSTPRSRCTSPAAPTTPPAARAGCGRGAPSSATRTSTGRSPRRRRSPPASRTSSPAPRGATSGTGPGSRGATAASSRSPRSSRWVTRTSSRCTSAPRSATG